MKQSKTIFLTTVILVMIAGLAAGRLSARLPIAGAQVVPAVRLPQWMQQLNLTPDQAQQMDVIWQPLMQQLHSSTFQEKRRALEQQREKAILALLNAEQRTAYEKITDQYRAAHEALDAQRQNLIDDANAKSRTLLNPSQQSIWDEQIKHMHDRHNNVSSTSSSAMAQAAATSP